ncbi:hypothetical protein [Clostridium vincentii]|uniref:Uncharacterized protein n=1 Tax=Clostridium vincentii TaxID=52704 RepID=A0A2T0BDW5_9CLOT|nr:hypothetical protein [Clostridium vincentii]PRR82012.1 hypothetical protein CLVI_20770 [Clostridium vincentii]
MKKVIKILLGLVAVVAIAVIVYMVILFPVHEYKEDTAQTESFDVNDMLLKSMPKNFSLENKKIQTTLSLTEDELKSLILPEIKKMGNVDDADIIIGSNTIEIYATQKVLKYFPTEISLLLKSEMEDGKSKLVLNDAKLGKIDLDKESILNKVKDNKIMFFDVQPSDNEIILEDEDLKDLITVTAIRLEDKKASVDIEVELNSMEDLMRLMNLVSEK